jgi:c-di-GMP-binding flagellar brake protein YcgR
MTGPPINTPLWVYIDGFRGEIRSRVEDLLDDGSVVIANPSTGGAEFSLAAGRELEIEWAIKRGVARQWMLVRAHVDVGIPGLLLEPLDEPTPTQRRDFVRVDALLPVIVELETQDPVRGTTLDISGGGMRAVIPERLEDGEPVHVTIGLPNDAPIECEACTLRLVDKETYAFEFGEIDERDRERLIRFVFAYQRELLREGKLTA